MKLSIASLSAGKLIFMNVPTGAPSGPGVTKYGPIDPVGLVCRLPRLATLDPYSCSVGRLGFEDAAIGVSPVSLGQWESNDHLVKLQLDPCPHVSTLNRDSESN